MNRVKWWLLLHIMRTLVRVFGVYDTFDAASSCAFWMSEDYKEPKTIDLDDLMAD